MKKNKKQATLVKQQDPAPLLKLDFGCGKKKMLGFTGIDIKKFEGVDIVMNVVEKLPKYTATDKLTNGYDKYKPWPWKDNSVDEVHSSHFLEHLDPQERIFFVNELCRVMKKDAKAQMIVPHWCSTRYYGDLTHKSPPISEMWLYYLNKNWREQEAPHDDFYTCDFNNGYGYNMHTSLLTRNDEYRNFALSFYKESALDLIFTLTKI